MAKATFSRFKGRRGAISGLTLTGTDQLRKALETAPGRASAAAARALYQEAETIMGASKEQVPVDTGALRATGHVELPEVKGDVVSVTMGYGTDYAVYVHEDLDAYHDDGNAKYLEKPVLEAAKGLEGRLAAQIRRELER